MGVVGKRFGGGWWIVGGFRAGIGQGGENPDLEPGAAASSVHTSTGNDRAA